MDNFYIAFAVYLNLIFVAAKLWDKIGWSWFWVMTPLIVLTVIGVIAGAGQAASFLTLALNPSGTSSCAIDVDDEFTAEFVFKPTTSLTGAHLVIGMFSDYDDVNDTHMAFIEYVQGTDTNWQIITRDATGEAERTKADSLRWILV